MSAAVIYISEELVHMCTCGECGIPFAVPRGFRDLKLKDKTHFWCPNGHRRHFVGKTKEEELQEKLDQERTFRMNAEARERAERELRRTAEKGRAIIRGKLRAQSERVKNGVCPCCNRTFQNLMRHMSTKHPGFGATEEK